MFESNSVLSSRNNTSIDFNNAIANQIEIRKNIGEVDWLFNTSFYYKKIPHSIDGDISSNSSLSFFEKLLFNISNYNNYSSKKEFYPIRIIYTEISKWFNSKFFLKGGFFS